MCIKGPKESGNLKRPVFLILSVIMRLARRCRDLFRWEAHFRIKHISKERQFILSSYIQAGAPEEIGYMAHPHLGSDNLRKIVRNLRDAFSDIGGSVLFETMLEDRENCRRESH